MQIGLVTPVLAASVRQEVADFVAAVFWVYSLILVAWIVVSLVLSLGLRPPYNRAVRGTLDFLHDTAEPFLRIFRRLGLRFGPLDLSPIVALIALRIVGGLLVGAIAPG
jgi:YggT family protein